MSISINGVDVSVFNLDKYELLELAETKYIQGVTNGFVYFSVKKETLMALSEPMEDDNHEWVLIYVLWKSFNNKELEMEMFNPGSVDDDIIIDCQLDWLKIEFINEEHIN